MFHVVHFVVHPTEPASPAASSVSVQPAPGRPWRRVLCNVPVAPATHTPGMTHHQAINTREDTNGSLKEEGTKDSWRRITCQSQLQAIMSQSAKVVFG